MCVSERENGCAFVSACVCACVCVSKQGDTLRCLTAVWLSCGLLSMWVSFHIVEKCVIFIQVPHLKTRTDGKALSVVPFLPP